jgi:phenylacetate-CoA ligase
MNKNFLKSIRDNIPEPLKYLTASIFRYKLINNIEFCKYSEMLAERGRLSVEEIKEYQFNELKKILIYSNNYVPYYANLFEQVKFSPLEMKSAEEINVIPYLTKELILNNFNKLISTKKVHGGHYVATTGGSTGGPLKILLDYESVFKENAFVNHFRKRLGYDIKDRLATFRGIEFGDKLWKLNPMQNELIFSPFKLSGKTITNYAEKIDKFKPDYLNGYLSSLYSFTRLLSEYNLELQHPIKGIFLISENINSEQRGIIESFFKVKSSTFYGHTERCIIAEEIEVNEYQFDPYYGYTELINATENTFEIVGTGFLNHTMPLIRYKTNDLCTLTGHKTVSIVGRWDVNDFLIGMNEEKVFHSAFNFHCEIFNNVTNYQIVQSKKGKADLLLVVNKNFKMSEIELMKKMIEKKTKGVIEFNIKVTDQLILSKRGKYKMFISEFKE